METRIIHIPVMGTKIIATSTALLIAGSVAVTGCSDVEAAKEHEAFRSCPHLYKGV